MSDFDEDLADAAATARTRGPGSNGRRHRSRPDPGPAQAFRFGFFAGLGAWLAFSACSFVAWFLLYALFGLAHGK